MDSHENLDLADLKLEWGYLTILKTEMAPSLYLDPHCALRTFWRTLQLKVFEKSHYKKFTPIKQTLDRKHVRLLRFSSLLHYFQ